MQLRARLALLVAISLSQLASTLSAQAPVVMRDARVSWPGGGAHFFWQIAASPTNPNVVVACSLRDAAQTAHEIEALIYGSVDGGESWKVLKVDNDLPTNSEVTCAMSGDS